MSLMIFLISLLSILFGTDEAEIVFAGDAMMHQRQIDAAKKADGSYNFSEYFNDIRNYVETADYAVVNLETPVSTAPFSGYPLFNAPAQYLDALSSAGFDLFLTANNHTLDRRDSGLRNTLDSLDKRDLSHIGTYRNASDRNKSVPHIVELNGIKTAFLNYTYGTNGLKPGKDVIVDYIDTCRIKSDIEACRNKGAEFIFACVHWGLEYQMLPNANQRELAEFMKNAGADAIIGGHPHVVQPMELKDGRLTVFSLGNFISGMLTKDTRGGAMVKVRIKRGDDGKVYIENATYRLVFTEPGDNSHNFRLKWADSSCDVRAKAFSKSARDILDKHNINVAEELFVR